MQPFEPLPTTPPETVRETPHRSRWLLAPPPMLFALPLVGAAYLHALAPLPLLPGVPGKAAGAALIIAAMPFLLIAPLLFAIDKTTIVPHGQPRTLIERGPYRVSRNPMYVGLVAVYLGVTLLLGSAWPLLFVALPVWVMQTKTIPFEERALERMFGDAYREYARRVRRWL